MVEADESGHPPGMDAELNQDLDLPGPLGSGPFTTAMAAAVGLSRSRLEQLVRRGLVRRILRGVYAGARVPDGAPLRGSALALVLAQDAVVVDRTAAWVHGIWPHGPAPRTVDTNGRARATSYFGAWRPLSSADLCVVGGTTVTTPMRTAGDLGRLLRPDRALCVLDLVLHEGCCGHSELVAELPRHARLGGHAQLCRLIAAADGRAGDSAESVLRLRWLTAGLPTPVPRLEVASTAGPVVLSLAACTQRFAAVFGESSRAHRALESDGWRLVPLTRLRVLGSDAALVEGHLLREYHQHLLGQVD